MGHAALIAVDYVGATFIAAGVAKLLAGNASILAAIAGYRLLPPGAARLTARALPWTELIVGLWLLAAPTDPWSRTAASIMLATFSTAVAVNLIRGNRDIDCGCFGRTPGNRLTWSMVVANGSMVVALWVLGSRAHDPVFPSLHAATELALGGALVAGTWLLKLSLGLLREQRRSLANQRNTELVFARGGG